MAILETYDRKGGGRTLAPAMRTLWRTPKMAPGTFVEDMREPKGDRGFGTVVGITEDEIAVLWSSPPRALTRKRLDLNFNPLAFDEDIFIPVGTPREEAERFIAAGRPHQTSQQDAEDIEYFRKNLFAALKVPKEMLR